MRHAKRIGFVRNGENIFEYEIEGSKETVNKAYSEILNC